MDPRAQQEQPFSLGEEFEGNPFEGILRGGQQGEMPGGASQGGQPQDPEAEMKRLQEMQDPKRNQLLQGANPGQSKYLLGAIQQIQGFIAESTERDEIAIGRSIIQLLTRLVAKDQKRLADKLASDNQAAQQPPAPSMPGGMPGGAPQGGQPQGGPQGY